MAWEAFDIQCPRCGFTAIRERNVNGRPSFTYCVRCGYSEEYFFNCEKAKTLGIYGKHDPIWEYYLIGKICPDELAQEYSELEGQCWETEIICPPGSYVYRPKGKETFTVSSIVDGSIEKLVEHLDEYDTCKYTFYRHGAWHIKDLLDDATVLFSEEEYQRSNVVETHLKVAKEHKSNAGCIYVPWDTIG